MVHRSDGSGTTFNLVNYLSKLSPDWREKVGEGAAVDWPIGVGGKGNEGVAAFVSQTKGTIGYVEYAYVLQNKMTFGLLQNQAGKFVGPEQATFEAAASGVNWADTKDFYLTMTDAPGEILSNHGDHVRDYVQTAEEHRSCGRCDGFFQVGARHRPGTSKFARLCPIARRSR